MSLIAKAGGTVGDLCRITVNPTMRQLRFELARMDHEPDDEGGEE